MILPATFYPLTATRYPSPATRYPLPATRHPLPATRHPPPVEKCCRFGSEDSAAEILASVWQEEENFEVLKRCYIQIYPTSF